MFDDVIIQVHMRGSSHSTFNKCVVNAKVYGVRVKTDFAVLCDY